MKPERFFGLIGLALLIGGCSNLNVNLWPFGDDKAANLSSKKIPDNATEYRCEGNRSFYLRFLSEGKSAWVILPDRQFRLDATEPGKRYSNGKAVLAIDGTTASLTDSAATSYLNCNSGTAANNR